MDVSTWKTAGSIAKLLAWRVAEAPEADFVCVEDEGPWSFAAIAREAVRLYEQLFVAGVGRGDLVIVRVGNDERFP
ncbi:MAG TPA: hypothetical protein VN959_11955, partial [Mycobacterium sp.]|nr:hypothetical protein [Mycobacterium sp.]